MGTRIVVMKDGVVQQVDSPTALYSTPCNMFVAGFIGSPQMNFADAKIDKREDGTYILVGSNEIKLPEGKAKILEETGFKGTDVVLGIRPEDIHDDELFISNSQNVIDADVSVTEPLGAETYLYLTIEGKAFTARVNPRTTAKPGDRIKIAFDATKIHLFDKETEKTIIN